MTDEELQKAKELSGAGDIISDEYPEGLPPGPGLFPEPPNSVNDLNSLATLPT